MTFDNFYKKLPLITAIFVALIWGLFYLLFDTLHGMQAMFDQQFPFFVARILGIHNNTMSVVSGVFFAMVDAAIWGAVTGWLLRRMMIGKKRK